MADNNSASVARIRSYLEQHGGAVADAAGRGLTDEMARAIGMDRPAALSAILGQMEDDGVITREMRGLRTYRIALVDGASPPAPANGNRTAEMAPAAPATEAGGAVRLRDALARRPKSGATSAPATAMATVRVPAVEDAAPAQAPAAAPAGRAVSLRDALSQRTGTVVAPPPPPPPPPAGPASYERPARSVSPPGPTVGTGPAPAPARRANDDVVAPGPRPRKGFRMPRLTVPVPEVKSPPSTPIVTAVGIAMAGLVLLTAITVVFTRSSSHHVAAVGTVDSSNDACHVVSTDDATAAFGDPAGPPHFVLGSCVYDDGNNHELIVEVARQNARTLFDSSRSSLALDIPGVGDSAYYANGTLRVLKGSSLMLLTLSPFSPDKPSAKLMALAQTAQSHL